MLRIERLAKVTNSSAPIVSFSSDSPLLLGTELRRDRGKYGFQERWVESDGDGETDRQGEIGGERERNREREREREGEKERKERKIERGGKSWSRQPQNRHERVKRLHIQDVKKHFQKTDQSQTNVRIYIMSTTLEKKSQTCT